MLKRVFSFCFFLIFLFAFIITAQASQNDKIPEQSNLKGTEAAANIDKEAVKNLKGAADPVEEKLAYSLLQLAEEKYLAKETDKSSLLKSLKQQKQAADFAAKDSAQEAVTGVYVYIQLTDANFSSLDPYIIKTVNKDKKGKLAAVWADMSRLKELAALENVKKIDMVTPPVVDTGIVTTGGDQMHRANLIRVQAGINGAGIKVGVISDGVDSYAQSAASGDLPANLTVLSNTQGGDEGTAMLEIIHDMAPGAQLYFHDCGSNTIAFNNAFTALANAGCNVICDDISWTREPFFEDGSVARHIKTLAQQNQIVFTTSAGNSAARHYQGVFNDDGAGYHNFNNGASSYDRLYTFVPQDGYVNIVLQWNEPYGASVCDYDLELRDYSTGTVLAQSYGVQNGNDNPTEYISYYNFGSDRDVAIYIYEYLSAAPKIMEVFAYTGNGASMYNINVVKADSIIAHKAVPGVLACGAINVATPETIESFSCQGPVTMLTETRQQKPDICGADGVAITGAGGFSNPFYGTSAASPHVAAIAALIKSRFPTKNASEIRNMITGNGVDLGNAGFDNVYGFGRADALDAALSHFIVTFNSQGGSTVPSSIVPKNGTFAAPAQPTLHGYTFTGWFKDAAGTMPWNFASEPVVSDMTLYAKWTIVSHTVNVSANNAALGTTTGQGTYIYGSAVTLRATPYPGCGFIRWAEGGATLSTGAEYTFTATADRNITAEFAVLGAPALTAKSGGYNSVSLTWPAVSGANLYGVFRSTKKTGPFVQIGTPTANAYTDTKLTTGKTYYYKVLASFNGFGVTYGPYSAVKSAVPLPLAPQEIAAVKKTAKSIKIYYTKVSGATKYELYCATSKKGSYRRVTTTSSLYYTHKGLKKGKTYYYKVRVYRTVKGKKYYGPYSPIASLKL